MSTINAQMFPQPVDIVQFPFFKQTRGDLGHGAILDRHAVGVLMINGKFDSFPGVQCVHSSLLMG